MRGWFHQNKMHAYRVNFDHAISFNPTVCFGNRVHHHDRENLKIIFTICNE